MLTIQYSDRRSVRTEGCRDTRIAMSVKNGDDRRIIRIQNRSLSACRNDKAASCLVEGYLFDIIKVGSKNQNQKHPPLQRKKRQKSSDNHDIFLIFATELCKGIFAHIITY